MEEQMGKRVTRCAAIVLLCLVALTGRSSAAELRIGWQPWVPYAAVVMAKQKGWVDEELAKVGQQGMTAKWVHVAHGPAANEALASGALDAAILGDSPTLTGRAAGIDTILVGLASTGPKAWGLVVLKDSPLQSVKEVKGKKVSTLRGGNVHELLAVILQEAGLKMSDIEFISLGGADVGVALMNKNVDAAITWEPFYTKFQSEGRTRTLRDGEGLKSNLQPIIVLRKFAAANPNAVKAMLRAIKRGGDAIAADPQAAARDLAADSGLTPEQMLTSLSRFTWTPPVTPDYVKELGKALDFMVENGFIRRSFDMSSFIDTSYAP
jgi:sulfonate transport system substrate-binding protein